MFFLRFICSIRYYLFLRSRRFDGHFWKLERELTKENDAEELEERQAAANKHTTLQILTPHYEKISRCRVCGARSSVGGWNDMVVIIPPGRDRFKLPPESDGGCHGNLS